MVVTNTFSYPLMSETSEWFAVPGHIPKSKALKELLCLEMVDPLVDELDYNNSQLCPDCFGHGCDFCDENGLIFNRLATWRDIFGMMRRSYVKRDENRPHEEWYVECAELDEGAEPVTVLDI